MKARGILWFATATTAAEASAAEAAGADAIIAQGMEAGGHRGTFDAGEAEHRLVGLFALVPQIVDAVSIPVIAAGGIADARGIAAALMLGASAAMIGTGFLRCPEAKINPAGPTASQDGRPRHRTDACLHGKSGARHCQFLRACVRCARMRAAPASYPIQRGLTAAMRDQAREAGDTERMQMWAGQSARLARPNRPLASRGVYGTKRRICSSASPRRSADALMC